MGPQSAKETSAPCFYFCKGLASASLVMKQPKGEETAQAKGHQQSSVHRLLAFLLLSLPPFGQQHSFLIRAILYLSKVAVESVFTRYFLMLNLERNNAPQKVLSESSNIQNVLQTQVDCNGLWDMI